MIRKSWIIGWRGLSPNREFGVFVAPPGLDAETAAVSQLTLHATSRTAQIVQRGVVSPPFPKIIPHGLSYTPIAIPNIITSTPLNSDVGYIRPMDNSNSPWTVSDIGVDGVNLTFNQAYLTGLNGGSIPRAVNFFVFNQRAPGT